VTVEPQWLEPFRRLLHSATVHDLSPRFHGGDESSPRGAILILLGERDGEPDILLTQRALDMRSHPGQPAFPGGRIDPGETAIEAALREAMEETGVDPAGVHVLGELPELWLPPTNFLITPVLAHWHSPSDVFPVDPREVAQVVRIPLRTLADPDNRVRVRAPSGYLGPGFVVEGLQVWGFTAGVLDRLLALTGWEEPWDAERIEELR
jgi:8-oxo-dGTP pyrophosphatase MutT (NUDIX family)